MVEVSTKNQWALQHTLVGVKKGNTRRLRFQWVTIKSTSVTVEVRWITPGKCRRVQDWGCAWIVAYSSVAQRAIDTVNCD
jgi:hypothetical protein